MALITGKLAIALGAAYLARFYHTDGNPSECWAKYRGRTWIVGIRPPKPEFDGCFFPIVIAINGQTGAVIGGTMKGEELLCRNLAHRISEAVTVRRTDLGSAFNRISWAQMISRSKPSLPTTHSTILTLIESLGDKWQISRDGTAHCGKRWIRLSRPDRRIIQKLAAL
jgi:hypothetical protein